MGKSTRLDLTDDDRAAVAAGDITIADLAALRGVSRQAVQQAFRRRGWATTPPVSEPAARPPSSLASARASASSNDGPAGGDAPPSAAEALAAVLDQLAGDDDDEARAAIADHARRLVAGNALLTLTQANALLSRPSIPPGALKAVSQAQLAAVEQLQKLGILGADLSAIAIPGGITMRIVELTASEVEKIRAESEAEFAGAFGGPGEADDLDDRPPVEIAAAVPQRSTENADVGSRATSHRVEPRRAVRGFAGQESSRVDLDVLRSRLWRSIEQRGRAMWRTFAIAHGLDGPREAEAIVELLVAAAGNDADLVGRIEHNLRDFGD